VPKPCKPQRGFKFANVKQIAAVEWRRGIAEEEEEEKDWKKGDGGAN
jgi:hypothetical protein